MNVSSGATTVIKGIRKFIKKQKKPSDWGGSKFASSSSAEAAAAGGQSHTDQKSKRPSADITESETESVYEITRYVPPYDADAEPDPIPAYRGPNLFLRLPNELLAQIIVEIGKLPSNHNLTYSWSENRKLLDPKRVKKWPLMNFGLTCRRHLGMALPEVYREIELDYPLSTKLAARIGDLAKAANLSRSLTFRLNIDTGQPPRPHNILELFPNLTKLKLSFKFTDARTALNLMERSLMIFKNLKHLAVTGRISPMTLSYLDPNDIFTAPSVPLESLKIFLFNTGSPVFIMKLSEILMNSCKRVKNLAFKPFSNLENQETLLNWGGVGYAMRSESLEELRLSIPSRHSLGLIVFLSMVPSARRDKVKVLHLGFAERSLGMSQLAESITNEILRFPNLVSICITYIQSGESISPAETKKSGEIMLLMYTTLARELKNLRDLKCYESAFGGHAAWHWKREEGKPWDEKDFVQYPRD